MHQIQRGHLTRFIVPIIGARRLQKLAPADLRRLFDQLDDEGLGASSQRQVHQFLVSALGDAFRLELVARNVTEIVKPAPLRGKERKALPSFTAEETGLFLAAAHEDWRGAFFVLTLSTGMRRGEVAGLRWQGVKLEAGTAEVVEVVAASDDGPVVTTSKTGNSRRTVYLSPDTVQLLCEERARILSDPVRGHVSGYQRKRAWVDSGRVFVNDFGATLDPHNLRRDMLCICEAVEVRPLPIHGLRHTYASLSLRHGMPVEVVSKQLGHALVTFPLTY